MKWLRFFLKTDNIYLWTRRQLMSMTECRQGLPLNTEKNRVSREALCLQWNIFYLHFSKRQIWRLFYRDFINSYITIGWFLIRYYVVQLIWIVKEIKSPSHAILWNFFIIFKRFIYYCLWSCDVLKLHIMHLSSFLSLILAD